MCRFSYGLTATSVVPVYVCVKYIVEKRTHFMNEIQNTAKKNNNDDNTIFKTTYIDLFVIISNSEIS